MPLQRRILLSLISIAIIPLALFSIVAYNVSTNNLSAVERDALHSGTNSAKHALDNVQSTLSATLTDYTQWDDLHRVAALDSPDNTWLTENFAPETPSSTYNNYNLELLSLWNAHQKLLYNTGLSDAMITQLETVVKESLMTDQPHVMLLPEGSAIYLIGLAATRTSDGKDPNGVLLFGRKLGSQDAESISELIGYDVAIYQGSQQVIGPDNDRPTPTLEDLNAVVPGNGYWTNQHRDDFALAFAPIQNTDGPRVGTLVMWRPRDALQTSQDALRSTLLLAFGIGSLLALLVAVLLGRSIVLPLVRMASNANMIASGEYHQRIPVASLPRDALLNFANAFNDMTEKVAEQINALSHQVREIDDKNHALQIANAKAEEAVRIKSEFLATMSHELRTPLNAVIGYSEIISAGMAGDVSEEALGFQDRIHVNAAHLLNLIGDILDLSKIEAGRIEIIAEPFSVHDLLRTVLYQTKSLADNKNLKYITETELGFPEIVIADSDRLKQVLINLVSNAIKFTIQGEISVRVTKSDPAHWQISVSDTGIGIPLHAQDYIFDEFRQVDGATAREYGGTGLGLSIARKLTILMGGSIRLKSAPNEGSTFTITLPLVTAEQTPQDL